MPGKAVGTLSTVKARSPRRSAVIASAPPRKGTCSPSTLARRQNSSPDRWTVVPMPEEPKATPPRRVRAQATSSAAVRAGTCAAGTTRTSGASQASDTGRRSRSGS
jgi:hypothetical protein